MATLRTASPAAHSIFRFMSATPSTSAASRRCSHCLKAQRCPFSSFRPTLQNSKRPLMTESSYRPQTLEQPNVPPTPPRNAGVPETSITGGDKQQQQWPPRAPWEKTGDVSVREGEAQKSKPTTSAATTQTPASTQTSTTAKGTAPAASKKSKLRPRKAAMNLSAKAVEQLRELFEQPESKYIRVGVKNRGCSGLAYHLEYVDKPGMFDEAVEQDGVKVLIDSKALFSIIGSEMDWQEDKLSARFVFRNPNITEQCGCGESFSIS